MTAAANKPTEQVAATQMRTAVRFPLRLAARVETEDGPVDAMTVDISATGVLFVMPVAPAIDTRLRWTLRIPAAELGSLQDVTVLCVGRVVRHGRAEHGRQVAAVIDGYHMEDSHG